MLNFTKQPVAQRFRGERSRVDEPASALIVGGGLAGVAAATVLAERGVAVSIIEREPSLGGRAGGWTDALADGEPFEMERGFHAFFRNYYNLRALLRRVDPTLRHLQPLEDYPTLGPGGVKESFAGLPKSPPWNLLELMRRSPRLRFEDLRKVNGPAALEMLAYDRERTLRELDDLSAKDYLDGLDFPEEARRLLFDVFAHSFFNPEEAMSAAEMIAMFHLYFTGNPEGLLFDVVAEPLSLVLWRPLRRYLEGLGVTFHLGAGVERLDRTDGGFAAHLPERPEPITGQVALLAADVEGLKAIVGASPDLEALRPKVEPLGVTAPFVVWRLWLDRPLPAEQEPFIAASGFGELDLICRYEHLEGESRRWSLRTGGSVLELHAYAAPEGVEEEAIKAELLARFHEAFPESREAEILEERLLIRQDCPAFPPGSGRRRPGVETPIDGLALAGDFVDLPFPAALMERATSSGMLAANALMDRWGLRPEPLWSVPDRGLFASFQSWRGPSPALAGPGRRSRG